MMRALANSLTRIGGIRPFKRSLFGKYVALFTTTMLIALLIGNASEMWFFASETRKSLFRIQADEAKSAAFKIERFIKEVETQVNWVNQLPWALSTIEQRHIDGLKLLRQTSAITEIIQLDSKGREQLRLSRVATDTIKSQRDWSGDPFYIQAAGHRTYYGPVYFENGTEPHLRLGVSGIHPEAGTSIADINLTLLSDVIAQTNRGETGYAYVVDSDGQLIADSDVSMVLRHTNLSRLPHVQPAEPTPDASSDTVGEASDLQGQRVLSAHAAISPVGWRVFVELPLKEAYAPLYASLLRSGLIVLFGLLTAFLSALYLAYRTVVPIRTLQASAARLGSGDLSQRIVIQTGDELETLGNQFNSMAAQLQESYGSLERKIEERTRQLAETNAAKSRFIAVASHDLRQPLHALGLFIEQLRVTKKAAARNQLFRQINLAVGAMNELFHQLLDLSKLEAGIVTPDITDFPIARLLARIESTFGAAASQKGLCFRIRYHQTWIRSDFVLLERIIQNLVSNALRYTESGGVLIGCRRRGRRLHIEVWDSGPGIPEHQRVSIFGEFYRLAASQDRGIGGLGLGLAIVDRLCSLLDHRIEVHSRLGGGSCFAVTVPLGVPRSVGIPPRSIESPANLFAGRHAAIVDDDRLVLEAMGGLLQSWGCTVVAARSEAELFEQLEGGARRIDFIICDHRQARSSGIEVVAKLRGMFAATIPALIVSGDTTPQESTHPRIAACCFLHKPVLAPALRAVLSKLLADQDLVVGN